MRLTIAALFVLSLASPAGAQTLTVAEASRFDKAPWWMDQPIIASSGLVETDLRANRAQFRASFQVVDASAATATRGAAEKVRALGQALAAYGADRVRVETTFSMRPLYEQYRDREGNRIDNQRSDKIESYEVNANVSVEVRDVSVIERVYASVLAARPTQTSPVSFRLEADNAARTELAGLAVADASARARQAVTAAGARLGPVRLIDPTGRACETDVLVAGAPRSYEGADFASKVDLASPRSMAPPPAPPPPPPAPGAQVDAMELPLQPPMEKLQARACVIYGLAN